MDPTRWAPTTYKLGCPSSQDASGIHEGLAWGIPDPTNVVLLVVTVTQGRRDNPINTH